MCRVQLNRGFPVCLALVLVKPSHHALKLSKEFEAKGIYGGAEGPLFLNEHFILATFQGY